MPQKKQLTIEDLAQHFHKPIVEVAELMGVCTTVLKKICRRYGIQRWPQRKLQSINKIINTLHLSMLTAGPVEQQRLAMEINSMQKRKALLVSPKSITSAEREYYQTGSCGHYGGMPTHMAGASYMEGGMTPMGMGAASPYGQPYGCLMGHDYHAAGPYDATMLEIQYANRAAQDAARQLEEAGAAHPGPADGKEEHEESPDNGDEAGDESASKPLAKEDDPALMLLAMRGNNEGGDAAADKTAKPATPNLNEAWTSPKDQQRTIVDKVSRKRGNSALEDDQFVSPAFQRARMGPYAAAPSGHLHPMYANAAYVKPYGEAMMGRGFPLLSSGYAARGIHGSHMVHAPSEAPTMPMYCNQDWRMASMPGRPHPHHDPTNHMAAQVAAAEAAHQAATQMAVARAAAAQATAAQAAAARANVALHSVPQPQYSAEYDKARRGGPFIAPARRPGVPTMPASHAYEQSDVSYAAPPATGPMGSHMGFGVAAGASMNKYPASMPVCSASHAYAVAS